MPGQGGWCASNELALVQSHTQGPTEVPLLTPVRRKICLTASRVQWPGCGSRGETAGRDKNTSRQNQANKKLTSTVSQGEGAGGGLESILGRESVPTSDSGN